MDEAPLKTSFLCFKWRGRTWPLVPLGPLPPAGVDPGAAPNTVELAAEELMTELAPLWGLRLTVPWLELELGVGLWGPWGPAFLSSLEAVSEDVDPELTPEELWMTRLGGPPLSGLRPSERLRPVSEWAITDPAIEWLLIEPARRLALSRHKEEAKILARTLCLLPSRTEK